MSIFHKIKQALGDAAYIWWQEMRQIFRDEGIIIFFIVVPLAYPLLYSWIYNNEAVHEVPVVVVDMSHSQLSRQFIRDYSYMTLFPGLAIMLCVLSLNLLGDGLRDALDPKLKR